eukprot:scaffold229821_cov38-Tisochrysis_lutea.AAC.1
MKYCRRHNESSPPQGGTGMQRMWTGARDSDRHAARPGLSLADSRRHHQRRWTNSSSRAHSVQAELQEEGAPMRRQSRESVGYAYPVLVAAALAGRRGQCVLPHAVGCACRAQQGSRQHRFRSVRGPPTRVEGAALRCGEPTAT